LLLILSLTLLSSSCKKHVIKPIDQLPPATQTGANTFGCLVNGAAFLPAGGDFSGPIKQCNYIYTSGGFSFDVGASNKNTPAAGKRDSYWNRFFSYCRREDLYI